MVTEDELTIIEQRSNVKGAFVNLLGGKDLKTLRLFKAEGCNICQHTGFGGRTGIFEILNVTDSVRQAVMKELSAEEIEKVAIEEGMVTMLTHGLEKVMRGRTSLEEVLRVTR